MATKTIAWQTGIGYITLSYQGQGDGAVSVSSDSNDSYDERAQYVGITTTDGSPQLAVSVLIKQDGKRLTPGTVYNYNYTGSVQQITLPPGRYKLQCWGAQGGNSGSYSGYGSNGGYSEGVITLTETNTLYVFVGGKGASSGNGGWNGGGRSTGQSSYNSGNEYGVSYPACGGGATDIALVSSDMTYSSGRTNRSAASLLSRCIVAGGGAGGSAYYREVTTTNTVNKENYIGNYSRWTANTSTPGNYISYFSYSYQSGKKYKIIINGSYNSANLWNNDYSKRQSVSSGQVLTCSANYNMLEINTGASTLIDSVDIYEVIAESTTSTDTTSGSSSSNKQGGGTSGCGTYPGTQASPGSGGTFGAGANQGTTNYRYASGAGGGGWYGGGSAYSDSGTYYIDYSGGGSGFVNTPGASRPSGYTGRQLDSGTTIAGNSSHPSISGGSEYGHSGNGYARITVIE